MKAIKAIFIVILFFIWSCDKEKTETSKTNQLTIFFVNDVHGQIDNFSKIKQIVDAERGTKNVLLVSSGDMFSGNPVVDNYNEKGFPIIDLMNDCEFDISVLGNHEFDYGPKILQQRIEQSKFPWICVNIEVKNSGVQPLAAFHTLLTGDLRITFLGLLETAGSKNTVIPSSHPLKVKDFEFVPAQGIIKDYIQLKEQEDADLLIALSHLGLGSYEGGIGDFQLAYENYFIDAIIGGHTHAIMDTVFSNTPIFHAGAYLHYLGKIEFQIQNKKIQSSKFELIDLDSYSQYDVSVQSKIDSYNDISYLKEVIGFSEQNLNRYETGCFYTDALRIQMNVDVAFQNTGGVRSGMESGDITVHEIFEISPFNNGTLIYEMTVAEIKQFLIGSESGFYYSGIYPKKEDGELVILDQNFRKIPDDYVLKVGINDYIPAMHSVYFPTNGQVQQLTAAETLIGYLRNNDAPINYSGCNRYFRY